MTLASWLFLWFVIGSGVALLAGAFISAGRGERDPELEAEREFEWHDERHAA